MKKLIMLVVCGMVLCNPFALMADTETEGTDVGGGDQYEGDGVDIYSEGSYSPGDDVEVFDDQEAEFQDDEVVDTTPGGLEVYDPDTGETNEYDLD